MSALAAESAAALEQISVNQFDPRYAAIQAVDAGPASDGWVVFDATFCGFDTIAQHAVTPLMRWLASDECDEQVAAEILRGRAGDVDLTAARRAVREVLDVLYELLEPEYPEPS